MLCIFIDDQNVPRKAAIVPKPMKNENPMNIPRVPPTLPTSDVKVTTQTSLSTCLNGRLESWFLVAGGAENWYTNTVSPRLRRCNGTVLVLAMPNSLT